MRKSEIFVFTLMLAFMVSPSYGGPPSPLTVPVQIVDQPVDVNVINHVITLPFSSYTFGVHTLYTVPEGCDFVLTDIFVMRTGELTLHPVYLNAEDIWPYDSPSPTDWYNLKNGPNNFGTGICFPAGARVQITHGEAQSQPWELKTFITGVLTCQP
jgi:hypothetical protein